MGRSQSSGLKVITVTHCLLLSQISSRLRILSLSFAPRLGMGKCLFSALLEGEEWKPAFAEHVLCVSCRDAASPASQPPKAAPNLLHGPCFFRRKEKTLAPPAAKAGARRLLQAPGRWAGPTPEQEESVGTLGGPGHCRCTGKAVAGGRPSALNLRKRKTAAINEMAFSQQACTLKISLYFYPLYKFLQLSFLHSVYSSRLSGLIFCS